MSAPNEPGSHDTETELQPLPAAYLAPGQLEEPLPWADRLITWLWLDVWGLSHALRPVRLEMRTIAVLLTFIFTFDYLTCGLLMNLILNRGALQVSFIWTPVAAIVALLPAGLLFLYERGFMTADTMTYGWLRLAPPTFVRMCVVAAWALLTTQPVELLVFSRPIDERVHEESVLRKIAELGKVLEKERKAAETGEGLIEKKLADERKTEAENKQHEAHQRSEELAAANLRLNAAVTSRKAADNALKSATDALRKAQRDPNARLEDVQDAQARVTEAERTARIRATELENARSAVNQASVALGSARQDANAAETVSIEATKVLIERAHKHEADASLIRAWIERLLTSKPGDRLPNLKEEADKKFKDSAYVTAFADDDDSFVDRLRVLNDLADGNAPRLRVSDENNIRALAANLGMDVAELGVEDAAKTKSDNTGGAKRESERAALARVVRYGYWVLFALSAIFPLMSFAFKLLMSRPLKLYYAASFMDQFGNPEAKVMESARRAFDQMRENAEEDEGSSPGVLRRFLQWLKGRPRR